MAKRELRSKALELRKKGLCYSEIKRDLDVAKSTLSDWLKNYPLSSDQMKRLKGKRSIAIEKYRATMLNKRLDRYNEILKTEKERLLPLNDRDLIIGGLFLYWGEGGKTNKGQVNISNSDPKILKIMRKWLLVVFGIPDEKMRIRLTLYTNMNIQQEKLFWSDALNLPYSQFRKIQLKNGVNRSNSGFTHGTCELVVTDTKTKTKILAGLEALGDWSEG
jgi:hypothetical protein